MKKAVMLCLVLLMMFMQTSCSSMRRYEFKYQSGDGDYSGGVYYSDSLFGGSACVYNPSLATASISFAMASFASTVGKDYSNKSVNARTLFSRTGFKDIDTNEFFTEKPGTDTLGCIFGSKVTGDLTMIACGIRGANYESEWASNFTIGADTEGNYHKGFYEGSEEFLRSLREYIETYGIGGKIRLWMFGYSRAGAVCNIAAGRIDEAIRDGVNILGDEITLAKEDLYAYCFEAPQGVYFDDELYPRSETFSNIFCIVNHNDFVPKVAMKEFSFTRFGVDKVLFDNMNDPNYEKNIKLVEEHFRKMENADVLGEYRVDDFEMKGLNGFKLSGSPDYYNWPQGVFLDDFLTHITVYGLKTREYYAEKMEEGLREIFRYIYLKGNPSASLVDIGLSVARTAILSDSTDILLDDLLYNRSKLSIDLKIVLMKALEILGVDVSASPIVTTVEELAKSLAISLVYDFEFSMALPLISKDNLLCVAQAHQPELILAFLRALDPVYTKNAADYDMSGRYYFVRMSDKKADVSVTKEGKEIARFENGIPFETGSTVPYGRHRELRIYLPYGAEYEIESSSYDAEIMVYDPAAMDYEVRDITPSQNGDHFVFTVGSPG